MTTAKTTQTFELSGQDLSAAVAEYIERKFGIGAPIKVDVRVVTVTTGYGMNEHDSHTVSATATREA